jgi:hypothetical protein
LADAAKATPNGRDANGTEDRGASALVKDLIAFIHNLNILREANLAVCIRRRAEATDTRVADTVKVEQGAWHGCRREAALNDWVDLILVRSIDMRIDIRLVFVPGRNNAGLEIAQWRRDIVSIISTNGHACGSLRQDGSGLTLRCA